MFPFNDPNLQQGMMFNPNFNIQGALLGNLNGGNLNNFHGLNPNLQPMAQNNQLAVLQLAAQIQSNPQLQMNMLHLLQSQNRPPHFPQGPLPYLGHTPSQMMGVPNPIGQFAMNQILQGNQMMGPWRNPHLGQNNLGLGFGNAPGTMGHNPVYGSLGASVKSNQPPMSFSPKKTQWNNKNAPQAIGGHQFQVNHAEAKTTDNTHADAQNSAIKGSARNSWVGNKPSHNRFQKSQLHDMESSKRYMKQPKMRGGRGQHGWRVQKLQSKITGEEVSTVCRRPIPFKYTRKEVNVWRHERKRNYPTTANVIKKLARLGENNEDADSKLRRQELKEILAKQAELGVEVAEIPHTYLCEPGDKFNKRRGSEHDDAKWHSRRQKFENQAALTGNHAAKREPSLREKLLRVDIKRDRSRLLQALRFMVLNDFFKQSPAKRLEFPVITVKDDDLWEDEIVGEANPSLEETSVEGIGRREDPTAEQTESEEGEITGLAGWT